MGVRIWEKKRAGDISLWKSVELLMKELEEPDAMDTERGMQPDL